jgi:hypothetical protein
MRLTWYLPGGCEETLENTLQDKFPLPWVDLGLPPIVGLRSVEMFYIESLLMTVDL